MNLLKKKKVFSIVMMMALVLNFLGLTQFTEDVKASQYATTITFVDNTPQKWIGNDSAVIELVDNTYGHVSHIMKKTGANTWTASVPADANNITFNRWNPSRTVKWNSFSAGGRDGSNTYSAEGHEYGKWIGYHDFGFKEGDIVYLDTSSFTGWEKDGAMMYTNFTSATKSQNNGSDINIWNANGNFYQPRSGVQSIGNHMYRYVVTSADEGKTTLRFWRGNYNTLWNCSAELTFNDYLAGRNCVKVTGWNESGYTYRW